MPGGDTARHFKLSKTPFGAFRQVFAVCRAYHLSPQGDKFHTCSLRSVFCQVRAPAENFFDFICRQRQQPLRDLYDALERRAVSPPGVCLKLTVSEAGSGNQYRHYNGEQGRNQRQKKVLRRIVFHIHTS